MKTPMLDIVTVGSGGGSIAWTDPYGSLKVGPQSAGADPGPICYRRGGTQPTVTDAAIVLGRLPAALIGGEIKLDRRVGARRLRRARRAASDMTAGGGGGRRAGDRRRQPGVRHPQVTTSRGRDPGNYAMVAFGGAGGLFATEVADFLGMQHDDLAARSGQSLRLRPARLRRAARLHPHHRAPAVGCGRSAEIVGGWTALAEKAAWRTSARRASPAEEIEIAIPRRRPLFRRGSRGAGRRARRISADEAARSTYMWKSSTRCTTALRLPLRGPAGRGAGQSARPGRGRAAPAVAQAPDTATRSRRSHSRRGRSTGGNRVDRMPALPAHGARLGQTIEGPAIIEEYGSTVVVPRHGPAPPTPTATSSWTRLQRGGAVVSTEGSRPRSSARSSSR